MKKINTALFIFVLLCLTQNVFASHLYGGYLHTKKITGRLYEITLVVYSDLNSIADANTAAVKLQFGDGTKNTVSRTNTHIESVRFRKSIYTTQHEYASDGSFLISYSDNNLADGMVNINNGRSADEPLFIETLLTINEAWNDVYSPQPLAFEVCNTAVKSGYVVSYNPVFADPQNDSISYELASAGDFAKQGYQIPEGMKINAYSGTINWPLSTASAGAYLIYFKVNSYREGFLQSSSLIAQPFLVSRAGIVFPSYTEAVGCDLAPAGWFRKVVQPGDLMQLTFKSGLQQDGFYYDLTCHSGLFFKNTDSNSTAGEIKVMNLNWKTKVTDVSALPYFVVYRQRALSSNFINDQVLGVYVGAPLTTALHESIKNKVSVNAFPNPLKKSCRFEFELPGTATLVIYDLAGKQVFSQAVQNEFEWDRNVLPSGVYMFTLHASGSLIHRGKLILE